MRYRVLLLLIGTALGPFALPTCLSTADAYEQQAGFLARQWITPQADLLFRSQFGPSEIDGFLRDVAIYPNGPNSRFIEGVFDEDIANENPVNDLAPFNRHFWDYNATTFARTFNEI